MIANPAHKTMLLMIVVAFSAGVSSLHAMAYTVGNIYSPSACVTSTLGSNINSKVELGNNSLPGKRRIVVSNTTQLIDSLKAAELDETIELSSGIYRHVVIANVHPRGVILLKSLDSANPAVMVGLGIANSSNLHLDHLELTSKGSEDKYFAFRIASSSQITLSNLDFHGDDSLPPALQLNGLYISKSSDVTTTESRFHQLNSAVVANNNDGILFQFDKFYDLNKGGIEMGGSYRVEILDNFFHDFKVSRGTHPDVIQIYTANTSEIPHDIDIERNVYFRGNGDAAQGIFIQDEKGNLPITDLTIRDNLILGGMWNSIYLKHAAGRVEIFNNTVASWAGVDMPGTGTTDLKNSEATSSNFNAFIALSGDLSNAQVAMKGNESQAYLSQSHKLESPPPNNKIIGLVSDCGALLFKEWRLNQSQLH